MTLMYKENSKRNKYHIHIYYKSIILGVVREEVFRMIIIAVYVNTLLINKSILNILLSYQPQKIKT